MLAVKILQQNGFEVVALILSSAFFSSTKGEEAAQSLGIRYLVKDISQPHFEMVKNPQKGYGKNLNPCIDCHALMLKSAKEVAAEENCSVIATGEVLGQRPFSQTKNSLRAVEKLADLRDKVFRPLSAKLLPITDYEKEGILKRDDFLDIQGRNRKHQIELAGKFHITDFPNPAGGCKLTEKEFSNRLRELLQTNPTANSLDAKLLQVGRFFPLGKKSFAMLGRSEAENQQLWELESEEVYLITLEKIPSPTALLRLNAADDFEEIFPQVAEKIRSYSKLARENPNPLEFKIWGKIEKTILD